MANITETYLIDHFYEALEKKQIQAYFQPIFRSLTGKVFCAESLARWIDPEMGMIVPADFIPVLEKSRLICELDMEMLRQACAAYQELSGRGTPIQSFSVNLSRQNFQNEDVFGRITAILEEYHVPHAAVKLEITESLMLEDADMFRRVFHMFQEAGFSVWLDDFGSGYSSLNVLQNYSFDVLKFDMFFLHRLTDKGRKLLASLTNMAKTLGIHTLTEGVETEEQRDFLLASGCEAMQGYYFSKPLSRDDFFSLIEKNPGILEAPENKNYWDEIGRFNFLSPNPLKEYEEGRREKAAEDFSSFDSSTALVECSQDGFHYVYATEGYKARLRDLGFGSVNSLENALDNTRSMQYLMLRKLFLDAIQQGTIQMIEYGYKDVYYRISAQLVSRRRGFSMLALRLNTFDAEHGSQTDRKVMNYAGALFTTYDLAVLIYPEKNKASRLHTANNLPVYDREPSIQNSVLKFCETEVEPVDQKRYLQFLEFRSLPARIENSASNFIQGFFRMRWTNHPNNWRTARVTQVPAFDELTYLLTFQTVPDVVTDWLDRTAAEHPELLS